MDNLKVQTTNLLSVIQYAKLVSMTRGRIYQLIIENDDRIKVVKIANKVFIDISKSKSTLN